MKKISIAGLLIISIFSIFVLGGCKGEPVDGQYKELAQCLTEKNVKFYGAFWCGYCKDQKKIFGDDMQYINYVECDPKGDNSKTEECLEQGVKSYPTWSFPGQENITGVQQPEDLAEKANCEDALLGATSASTAETTTDATSASPAATTTESSAAPSES